MQLVMALKSKSLKCKGQQQVLRMQSLQEGAHHVKAVPVLGGAVMCA
jgi:hypothetical protein